MATAGSSVWRNFPRLQGRRLLSVLSRGSPHSWLMTPFLQQRASPRPASSHPLSLSDPRRERRSLSGSWDEPGLPDQSRLIVHLEVPGPLMPSAKPLPARITQRAGSGDWHTGLGGPQFRCHSIASERITGKGPRPQAPAPGRRVNVVRASAARRHCP